MRVAVIGSRNMTIADLGKPEGILVMPDTQGLLKWAAYLPEANAEPIQ